jgi:PAS domain S-box-containing protein
VTDIHDPAYLDRVFEADVLEIDDVTRPPFEHHDPAHESHPGVGLAIAHDGEHYGVLTVHFEPGRDPSAHAIEVLETIANDLGYFVANQLLRAEYKTFTDIVERIDDPVMLQGRDGTYRVVNEAVATLAGTDKSDLIGRDESAFMNPEAVRTVRERKAQVLETESPVSYKLTATFPDGRERTFSTVRYPSFDDAGTLEGTIAICRDITDLEEHQRLYRVLDRVLRHNVNNNMNVVQGYAEMIEAQAGGEISRYAGRIADNGAQLLDIARKQRKITDFLSDPDPVETVDLPTVLDGLIARVRTEYPEATVSVSCPPTAETEAVKAIEEAIEELVVNSIVHADQAAPSPTVEVAATPDAVRIRIADENRPIPEMDRAVLTGTTPLDTLRHGSGLGLWLVKLVVDHSGGRIEYEPRAPRGNVVTIVLPTQ